MMMARRSRKKGLDEVEEISFTAEPDEEILNTLHHPNDEDDIIAKKTVEALGQDDDDVTELAGGIRLDTSPLASSTMKEEGAASADATTTTNSGLQNSMWELSDKEARKYLPFVDTESTEQSSSWIDCYPQLMAHLDGVNYTVGVPCDHCVAICRYDDNYELQPLELDDECMDDVFSMAETFVDDEFGDELILRRTPQTLTLIGELDYDEDAEADDDDDDDEDDDDEFDDEDFEDEDLTEDADGFFEPEDTPPEKSSGVELLLAFEHREKDYHLVRMMSPPLIVGKQYPGDKLRRFLLTKKESVDIIPKLEAIFLDFHNLTMDEIQKFATTPAPPASGAPN